MPTPDTSIYSVATKPVGNHCVAGVGFDMIRPAAEFLCQRQTQHGPGLKVDENLTASATAGEGLRVRAEAIATQDQTVGGSNIRLQGGAALSMDSRDGGQLRVGIRADYVGPQGGSPASVRPYVEVTGSNQSRHNTVSAGACTDVTVVGQTVEVCAGVTQRPGQGSARVNFGAQLSL